MKCVYAALLCLTGLSIAVAENAKIKVRVDANVNPWTNLDLNNDPNNFQFAIVTDRTGGHREGIFEAAIDKLNLLQPEFVMSVGDLIEGGTEDLSEIDREWKEFNGFVNRLKMPFFYVPGNHDISNNVMYEEWNKRFGRSYYHFVYRNVLFLCLNTEDPPRTKMSAEQAAYVKKALDANKNVRWTLVFMHKPMWTYEEDTGWGAIDTLLQGRPYTVIAGHTHEYRKHVRNNSKYIVLATTGGSTELRGPSFGEFDEVAWMTMTDDGPILANLMLDGIWSEDILTVENFDLIRPALSGAAVRFEPVVSESKTFKGAKAKLRLTNDANVPMHAVVTLHNSSSVGVQPTRVEKSVPPNSVELVDVQLDAFTETLSTELPPLRAEWALTYKTDKAPPVEVCGTYRLVVDSAYPIAKAKKTMTIDGALAEWGQLPIACVEPADVVGGDQWWNGAGDGSYRFATAYDKEFVYFAVAVTDDIARQNASRRLTSQDSIELWIDARNEADRHFAAGMKEGNEFLRVVLNPHASTTGEGAPGTLPEGSRFASVEVTNGYTAELAIPVTYFNERQDGKWSALRLNLCLNDWDAEFSGPRSQIWWRHDWRSPGNVPGSGTFEKK
jgi:predicted phosphodiesterase